MNTDSAEITIELAKALIETLQANVPFWEKGYVRFSATEGEFGSNGTYVVKSEISLLDPFKFNELFTKVNSLGCELLDAFPSKDSDVFVFLLSVDSTFDYRIEFERNDIEKWKISKLNGASGLPLGLQCA